MQVGFISERGTFDAEYILRRLQEEYCTKRMSAVDQEKAFAEYQGKCWKGNE